jgi:hypothetical protein
VEELAAGDGEHELGVLAVPTFRHVAVCGQLGEFLFCRAESELQIAKLRLDGDADRLSTWLGAHRLPITVRQTHPPSPASSSPDLPGEFAAEVRLVGSNGRPGHASVGSADRSG